MKKFVVVVLLMSLFLSLHGKQHVEQERVVVAYVTSWTKMMPDPFLMTHINYAFGHVNDQFNGVRIDNEARLKEIVALKVMNPKLKILLSIGGWGSGRFSEMAADVKLRTSFAKDCRRVVDEFGLDGIDIDWEYPTQSSANISSSPEDTKNFTLLMADLRKYLGKKKLVTAATVGDAKYIDFKSCIKYMDFVNMMSYDMANPPRHHTALYPSPYSGYNTCSQAMEAHLKAGVPREKLVMGMAFYGRGELKDGLGEFVKTHRLRAGYTEEWDDQGKVPYVAGKDGKLVLGFDNPRSLAIKCQYVIDQQLLGGMYWDYSSDDSQLDKARTLALSLLRENRGVEAPRKILVLAERGGDHEAFTQAALNWLETKQSGFRAEITVLESVKELSAGELEKYHLILQLNYPPFAWSDAARKDMETYIERGIGSYIGLHHASLLGDFEGYPLWKWFSNFLGGIRYKNYVAATTDGVVQTEDAQHPVMKGLPGTFVIPSDEWYIYDANPRQQVHVLAHVDECSYQVETDIKMGDHPVIWTIPNKPGRNLYLQFGHSEKLLSDANFVRLMENAIRWALYDE